MRKIIYLFVVFMLCHVRTLAQDTTATPTKEDLGEVKGALEGVNETVTELKNTVDALKKIKISGYIQAQFQAADSAGTSSFAGGDFAKNVRSRFQVRRGRFKINYDNDLSQYVLEVDVSQSGVAIKDAYIWLKEPWLRSFALTTGAFYRPFGYEVLHSHSVIETPEFARAIQTLLPGERDIGAQIEFTPEEGPISNFNFRAGFFNGVLNTANENDRNKDFIGRLGFQLPFQEENLAIDGGLSLYDGKVASNSKFVYSFGPTAPVKQYVVDSLASNVGGSYGRTYYGADLQLYYDIPTIGGATLRGEYIAGQQPGTAASNSFYNPGATVTPLYVRNFTGWYVNYIQNIGVKNQLVIKYDFFDPNSDVDGNDIGAPNSNFTIGDIKYSTFGLGWIYHWDANIKFLAYYDFVTNESVNPAVSGTLAPFREDVKDNVLTLRMQYKF
ncbi:MAG: hypothetical protein HY033_02865 [Ignavibacteriae bacterium]|nr:hypothetical protein [Ignavibacteria bacterium]MBI3363829.1 hypothetical protein [Ignavibacteriota bacterium]